MTEVGRYQAEDLRRIAREGGCVDSLSLALVLHGFVVALVRRLGATHSRQIRLP